MLGGTLIIHPLVGNLYSSPRTLLRTELAAPVLLCLAGIFHASLGPVWRLGHSLARAGYGCTRLFPWCPGTCPSRSTNATRATASQVGITHLVGHRRRALHFIDVALLSCTDSSHLADFVSFIPIRSFGIQIYTTDDRYSYLSTCCRSISHV